MKKVVILVVAFVAILFFVHKAEAIEIQGPKTLLLEKIGRFYVVTSEGKIPFSVERYLSPWVICGINPKAASYLEDSDQNACTQLFSFRGSGKYRIFFDLPHIGKAEIAVTVIPIKSDLPWTKSGDGFYIYLRWRGKTIYVEKVQESALGKHKLAWRFADQVVNWLLREGAMIVDYDGIPNIAVFPFYASKHTFLDVFGSHTGKRIKIMDPDNGSYTGGLVNQPKLTEENFQSILEQVKKIIRGDK